MDITDEMKSAVENIISHVREVEDPDLLSDYRKVFKKTVPRGLRSWVTAYFIKEALNGGKIGNGKGAKAPKRAPLADGTTLFVGVGKNRKVYPKDLIHLVINTGKLERDDIGNIKILDSYSFVSVKTDKAKTAISNLDGINYRGRNLNVNFAKKKEV